MGRGVLKIVGLTAAAFVLVVAGFRTPALDVWTRMIIATSVLGVIGLAAMSDRRARLSAKPVDFLLAALGTLVLAAGTAIAMCVPQIREWAIEMFEWKGGHPSWFIATTLVLAVAGEEIFWRACLVEELAKDRPLWHAVVRCSTINAAIHAASGSLWLCLAAFGTSIVWGTLYARTRRVTAPLLCHLAFDALVLFVLPQILS